jgi:hypothetical protein
LVGVPVLQAYAADVVVTLAPGQEVTVALDLWCLNYGKPFPTTIEGPTARPPDDVVKVMQTALQKGTVTTDVYQTQLAIWRATTGEYKDFAGQGSTLAQEIYEASQSATIPPPPADAISVEDGVKAGTLQVTLDDFTAIPVEGIPGHPFHGQANLVVENVSADTVKIVLLEGAVFTPVGEDAQALISHQNPVEQPKLPVTGGSWWSTQQFTALAALGLGLLLLVAGTLTRRSAR